MTLRGSLSLLVIAMSSFLGAPLQGSVLVHVDFDSGYTTGPLAGQSGATDIGLSGSFLQGATTGVARVVDADPMAARDLGYDVADGSRIAGGSHSVEIGGALGAVQDIFHRALSSDITGRTLFMRVVLRPVTVVNAHTYLRFYLTSDAPAPNGLGGLNGAGFGLRDAGGSGPGANAMMNNAGMEYSADTSAGVLNAAPNLLVAKFHWNGTAYDRISIWVNPTATASAAPMATQALPALTPSNLDVIGLGIINFETGQTIVIDSFAIGTQWEDVVPSPPNPTLVFLDSFDNGSLADCDFETGTWNLTTPPGSTAVEMGGELVQTAQAADSATVITSAATSPAQRFNFFDGQLKFGATVRMGPSDAPDTTTRRGRFILASEGGSGVSAADTFSLLFMVENALKLDAKVDHPNMDPNTGGAVSPKIVTANAGDAASFPYYNYVHQFHLTMDGRRYRLVSNVTPDGAIRARFSGEHGLDRAKWGAKGDSALILEAVRTGAAAGTSATASWETLRVEANSEPLLNEPFWDMDVPLTADGTTRNTKFRLWLPSTEQTIRGILFVGPGTGLDFRCMAMDPMVQEAARAIEFGVIAYSAQESNFTNNLGDPSVPAPIQAALNRAAEVSGHPEIVNAPLCLTGFSLGGYDAVTVATRLPDRTIAYVSQHWGSSPPPTFAAAVLNPASLKVPGLFVGGSTDWTMSYVKTFFSEWRAKGAQVAFVVDWGVDHNLIGNQGWEATWTWLVETVNLRYPRPLAPGLLPGQIPALVNLSDESGWLGDNITTSPSLVANPFVTVAPYASYPGNTLSASWYPNESCARTYRALTSSDMVSRTAIPRQLPLNIVSPPQYGDQVSAGKAVSIVVDPREFDDVRAITSMEFYDGATLLGTDSSGPEWSLSFVPTAGGLHSLTVVATDTAGNKGTALRALFVAPNDYSPVAAPQSLATAAGTEFSGTLAARDPKGAAVTFSINQSPAHGLLVLNPATGGYTYRPAHGFSGSDGFSFQATAGTNMSPATPVTLDVSPPADSDSDGMPDAWESLHEVSNPAADDDGDGVPNLQEYLSLTDPQDAADYFHVEALGEGASDGSILLQWPAKGGVRYRVQYSHDLASFLDIARPVAQEIQPGSYGFPGNASFTDDYTLTPPAVGGKRFYRIQTSK